jgi:hypothetical protein
MGGGGEGALEIIMVQGYLSVSTTVDLLSRNLARRLGLWITTF